MSDLKIANSFEMNDLPMKLLGENAGSYFQYLCNVSCSTERFRKYTVALTCGQISGLLFYTPKVYSDKPSLVLIFWEMSGRYYTELGHTGDLDMHYQLQEIPTSTNVKVGNQNRCEANSFRN